MRRNSAMIQKWEELAEDVGFSAGRLARICCVTPRHLRRQFHSALRVSPQEWLNARRLAHAAQELRSGKSVKEAALGSGFKQVSHFSRQFKMRSGLTPSEFLASLWGSAGCNAGETEHYSPRAQQF
jgi:AraC-like DNA-binding protein